MKDLFGNTIFEGFSINTAKKMIKALQYRKQRDIYYKRTIKEIGINENDLFEKFQQQEGKCYWTSLNLDEKYNLISKHPFAISVERLDNNIGYTFDNIVLTRRIFNLGRSDFPEKDFYDVIKSLKEDFKNI
jgi:hypothetical protein